MNDMLPLLLSAVFIIMAAVGLALLPWSVLNGPISSLINAGFIALCFGLFVYFIRQILPKEP